MTHKVYPKLSAIVAMDEDRLIGANNTLPWHMPADLRHFKSITTGHPILMGRKTYVSIGRPLPNRLNIVLTTDASYSAPGCVVVTTVEAGLEAAQQQNSAEVFIIGGSEVFRQLMPKVNRLYLTIIHHRFVGDIYFPALEDEKWREVERVRHAADAENAYDYSFITLDRVM